MQKKYGINFLDDAEDKSIKPKAQPDKMNHFKLSIEWDCICWRHNTATKRNICDNV